MHGDRLCLVMCTRGIASVGRVPAPFIGGMIPPCLDYRRAHVPGGTYFFVNTYRRQTFLTDVDVRSALREAIGTLRLTHPFVIEAWVLLPDHMHALWTLPPGDEDFSCRWRVIKRMVTQRCPSGCINFHVDRQETA